MVTGLLVAALGNALEKSAGEEVDEWHTHHAVVKLLVAVGALALALMVAGLLVAALGYALEESAMKETSGKLTMPL